MTICNYIHVFTRIYSHRRKSQSSKWEKTRLKKLNWLLLVRNIFFLLDRCKHTSSFVFLLLSFFLLGRTFELRRELSNVWRGSSMSVDPIAIFFSVMSCTMFFFNPRHVSIRKRNLVFLCSSFSSCRKFLLLFFVSFILRSYEDNDLTTVALNKASYFHSRRDNSLRKRNVALRKISLRPMDRSSSNFL